MGLTKAVLCVLVLFGVGISGFIRGESVFYADDGFHRTVPFPLNRNHDKSEFQHQILQLLGLRRPPRPRNLRDESAPVYMLDLYRSIHHEEEEGENDLGQVNPAYKYLDHNHNRFEALGSSDLFDHNQADVIMSFIDQENRRGGGGDGHLDYLSFDVTDVEGDAKLIGAELRLYSNGTLATYFSENPAGTLNVYLPLNDVTERTDGGEMSLRLVASASVSKTHRGWVVLNVTEALEHWILNPTGHSGLLAEVVEITGRKKSPHRDFGFNHGFMVGFFNAGNENAHRRVKRTATSPNDRDWRRKKRDVHPLAEYYDEHISRRVCQKRTLYVSFRDLGWEGWIIAPDGFAAYYCQGECSFPLQAAMNATNHAIVQTLVNLMDPLRAPQAKCAPSKLGPLKLLYFDDTSNVVLKKYNNMVVRACGCH